MQSLFGSKFSLTENDLTTLKAPQNEQAELSWGSVQAETVRLQRQNDPGLMDIHLKFTEICPFFRPKKTFGKHFGSKKCGVQKILGPKKFCYPQSKICMGSPEGVPISSSAKNKLLRGWVNFNYNFQLCWSWHWSWSWPWQYRRGYFFDPQRTRKHL